MHRYVVIKGAKNHEEAVARSPFFVGQKAEVSEVNAVAGADDQYSVFAEFELKERKPNAEAQ